MTSVTVLINREVAIILKVEELLRAVARLGAGNEIFIEDK